MPHLDEGILMALLDGELTGPEQREVEAHLRACADCRARLDELNTLMSEADQLVVALDDPATPLPNVKALPGKRRSAYHRMAWAATIVVAAGLGIGGLRLLRSPGQVISSAAINEKATASNVVTQDSVRPNAAPASAEVATGLAAPPVIVGQLAERDSRVANESRNAPQSEPERQGNSGHQLTDSVARQAESMTAMQPGVVSTPAPAALTIRGGRVDSAGRYVDGVPVQPGYRGAGLTNSASGQVAQPAPSLSAHDSLAKTSTGDLALANGTTRSTAREEGLDRARKLAAPGPSDSGASVITRESAESLLTVSVKLIQGLSPDHFEVLPDLSSSGSRIVRVVYVFNSPLQSSAKPVPVWLDQQRTGHNAATEDASNDQATQPADTDRGSLFNSIQWNDLQGLRLSLHSPLPLDSLMALKARIR